MPKDPNRITVDLQLLRSQELEKLQAFGKQFEDAISSLKDVMGGYSSQIAGAAQVTGRGGFGVTRAGAISAGASVASPGVGGTAGHSGTDPGTMSRHASFVSFGDRMSYGNYNLNQYERGYFSVGNLASMSSVDALRYASHLSGNLGWEDEKGPDGRPIEKSGFGRGVGRNASRVLGVGARGLMYGQSAKGIINRASNTGRSLTSFGQGLGMSSQNVMGIPFTSPASRYSLGQGFTAMRQSWFGLNPFYSSGQAREAHGIAAQYGMIGGDANAFAGRLKSLYEDRGMDQNVAGSMLNGAFRQGGMPQVDALTQSLYSLRDAASVAHMNTAQFTQDLQGLSASLQQAGLASPVGSSFQGQAYAAGTYLSPSAYGAAASSMPLTYMQMARFHEDMFTATHGVHAGSQKLSVQLSTIGNMVGAPMDQWGTIRKSDPARWSKMKSQMMMILQSPMGQQMFPGLTVDSIDKISMKGGSTAIGAARFQEDLIQAQAADKSGHLSASMIHSLVSDSHASGSFGAISKAMASMGHGMSLHDQLNLITKIQGANRQLTDSENRKLSIDLAPGAKKYFQLVDDVTNRNSQDWVANPSSAPRLTK